MIKRTSSEARIEKRQHLKDMESSGNIADSMSVRLALMQQVSNGEITLEQAQSELKKIKKNSKKQGLITRSQAIRRG